MFYERNRRVRDTFPSYISGADITISHRRIIFPCTESLRLTSPDNHRHISQNVASAFDLRETREKMK